MKNKVRAAVATALAVAASALSGWGWGCSGGDGGADRGGGSSALFRKDGGGRKRRRPERAGSGSALLRVQKPVLREVLLEEEFHVLRTLGEGAFGRVLLATHRRTGAKVAVKALSRARTQPADFYRELHYARALSPHPGVLSTFGEAMRATDADGAALWLLAAEAAPLGDLRRALPRRSPLSEGAAKRVARQLAEALSFVHSIGLVHRDVKAANVLVFTADLSVVKLGDFGSARPEGELAARPAGASTGALPPEVGAALRNERVPARAAADVWALAVLLVRITGGSCPWKAADAVADPGYAAFRRWQGRRAASPPSTFKRFTPRFLRLLRRLLAPEPRRRAPVTDVFKYLEDPWVVRSPVSVSPVSSSASPPSGVMSPPPLDRRVAARRIWDWLRSCEPEDLEAVCAGGPP